MGTVQFTICDTLGVHTSDLLDVKYDRKPQPQITSGF